MKFNPNPNKQAQRITFSRPKTVLLHSVVHFGNRPVKSTKINKHLGIMLDSNLSYDHNNTNSILNKVNRAIVILRKFHLILARHSSKTIYKIFIRPRLGYGDAIYSI